MYTGLLYVELFSHSVTLVLATVARLFLQMLLCPFQSEVLTSLSASCTITSNITKITFSFLLFFHSRLSLYADIFLCHVQSSCLITHNLNLSRESIVIYSIIKISPDRKSCPFLACHLHSSHSFAFPITNKFTSLRLFHCKLFRAGLLICL